MSNRLFRSTGYALRERAYVGGSSPPDAFEDESRFGNDGVHTDITWVQLPSGLWVRSFNGSSSKIIFGNPASIRLNKATILFWALVRGYESATSILDFSGDTQARLHFVETDPTDLRVRWRAAGGGYTTYALTDTITAGWHQLGFTWDSGTGDLNGIIDGGAGNTNAGLDAFATLNTLVIGEIAAYADYDSKLIKLGLSNYVLPLEVIASIFQAERHWFGV